MYLTFHSHNSWDRIQLSYDPELDKGLMMDGWVDGSILSVQHVSVFRFWSAGHFLFGAGAVTLCLYGFSSAVFLLESKDLQG